MRKVEKVAIVVEASKKGKINFKNICTLIKNYCVAAHIIGTNPTGKGKGDAIDNSPKEGIKYQWSGENEERLSGNTRSQWRRDRMISKKRLSENNTNVPSR